jgi:hypothetical protein
MMGWTVQLEQDEHTGELILPLPPDLLSQMGWSDGTELWWTDNENGTFSLREKRDEEDNTGAGVSTSIGRMPDGGTTGSA